MRTALAVLALVLPALAAVPGPAQAAPGIPAPLPPGPPGAAFCDGNRQVTISQCLANVGGAVPVLGPVAGAELRRLALLVDGPVCHVGGGDRSPACGTADRLFMTYVHERMDSVLEPAFGAVSCTLKYGTPRCPAPSG